MFIRDIVFESRLTLRQAVTPTRWLLPVPNTDVQIEEGRKYNKSSRADSRIRRFEDQLLHYQASDVIP